MTQTSNFKDQKLLQDLKDLEVAARILQSQASSGRVDNIEDMAQQVEDLRLEQFEMAESISKQFDSRSAEMIAKKYGKAYEFNPANVAIYLKEMVADIAELYAKAIKLMMENARKAKHRERAEQLAKDANMREKFKNELQSFKPSEKEAYTTFYAYSRPLERSRATSKPYSRQGSFVRPFLKKDDKEKQKKPSNLHFAKSSEAKAREARAAEKQRALTAPTMARQSSPARVSQMSRF